MTEDHKSKPSADDLQLKPPTEVVTTSTLPGGDGTSPLIAQANFNFESTNVHLAPESQLPDIEYLKSLNEMVPGATKQYLKNLQDESKHRRDLESRSLQLQEMERERIWQDRQHSVATAKTIAIVLGLASAITAALFAYWGHPWSGTVFGGSALYGIVRLFLTQQNAVEEDTIADLRQSEVELNAEDVSKPQK